MGFWIFTKSGELDNRFKVVKDGKTALYSLLAIVVVCFILFYFIYLYLFILLPLALSIACYQYSSKTFKATYAISISIFLLFLYSIQLAIMTGQNKDTIFGNYEFTGEFKMSEQTHYGSTMNYKASKKINIYGNANFIEQLQKGGVIKGNIKKQRELISYANDNKNTIIEFINDAHNGKEEVDRYYYGFLEQKESNNVIALNDLDFKRMLEYSPPQNSIEKPKKSDFIFHNQRSPSIPDATSDPYAKSNHQNAQSL